MNKVGEGLFQELVKEHPTSVLILGMCPALAVTESAIHGLGMGLSIMVILVLSSLVIPLVKDSIPSQVRIPVFIMVIATFVTLVELLLEGSFPDLYRDLGIYIPLISVNCVVLDRAESYASKNSFLPSLFDALGMGLGFFLDLTVIGGLRELIGIGKLFGYGVMPAGYVPFSIFILAPGAFFVLACFAAIHRYIKIASVKKKNGKEIGWTSGI